jgi:hypothetical protein
MIKRVDSWISDTQHRSHVYYILHDLIEISQQDLFNGGKARLAEYVRARTCAELVANYTYSFSASF